VLVANAAPVLFLAVRRAHDLIASRCEMAQLRTFATFGLPMAVVGISATCIAISDRYVIAAVLGVDDAGMYSAPYDLTFRSLNMAMLGCYLTLSPMVFRSFDRGDEVTARQHLVSQARLQLALGLPLAFMLGLGAPLVSRIAFGEDFRETAERLIPWFAAAAFLQGLQAFYLAYLFTLHRRTMWNAAICLVTALVNLALNLLLVPIIGVLGAAVGTLFSYAFVITASVLVARRWMKLPWPTGDVVKVVAACTAAAPLALAARSIERPLLPLLVTGLALLVALTLITLFDTAGMRVPVVAAIRRMLPPRPAGQAETPRAP
jgi:O-antigen/teichoic acid export membrane protein